MYLRKSKYNIGIVLLQQVGVSRVCLGLGNWRAPANDAEGEAATMERTRDHRAQHEYRRQSETLQVLKEVWTAFETLGITQQSSGWL